MTPRFFFSAALASANPFASTDSGIAWWFHAHLTPGLVRILRAFCQPGSSEWIAVVIACLVAFFVWKRWWASLFTLVVAVPGGMLLNELVKVLVHRQRPFAEGTFVDWSGYSFASGHTIGATLLYGQLLLFALPLLRSRRARRALTCGAAAIVLLVGFGRIALGAHYLTDVVAAMLFGSAWLALCGVMLKPMSQRRAAPIVVEQTPNDALV